MTVWSWLPIVILFVLFFMKVPIAYSMLIATAVYFMFGPNAMDVTSLVQQMVSANQSFVFLAIPFFTAAGVIFNYSGITRRLLGLADLLVGPHVRRYGTGQHRAIGSDGWPVRLCERRCRHAVQDAGS